METPDHGTATQTAIAVIPRRRRISSSKDVLLATENSHLYERYPFLEASGGIENRW
jgi:hypothetical protein